MWVTMFDFRFVLQGATFTIMFASLVMILYSRLRFGRLTSGMPGVVSLVLHIMIFYASIGIREFVGFDITEFVNECAGTEIISYGLWSSAIRLQTAILLVFMVLTVIRRQSWIKSIGE